MTAHKNRCQDQNSCYNAYEMLPGGCRMKEYRGMYKLYFEQKSPLAASKMAAALHDSVSAITPVFPVSGHPGFILYCDELLYELAEIRKTNQLIDRLADRLPTVARQQFLRHAMIEEIHQTNEMEDIHSTRKEIGDELTVIENGKKGKRFDGMIRKYQQLLQRERPALASCRDIRNLYDSFVLDEVIKEDEGDAPDGVCFRKGPVTVVRNMQTVHEGIFPETALNEAMENALLFLNDPDYDPLIRVAAFHYMFGYAHPFYNGNGRMTRFISSSVLTGEGIHLLVALRLSYVIKSHRSRYYELFKTTNDHRNYGDMTRFVIGFLGFVREAGQQVLSFLREKSALLLHYRSVMSRLALHQQTAELLYILVQVSVCESDSLSLTDLKTISETSIYLVKKRLREIERYTIRASAGRSVTYRADLSALDRLAEGAGGEG